MRVSFTPLLYSWQSIPREMSRYTRDTSGFAQDAQDTQDTPPHYAQNSL